MTFIPRVALVFDSVGLGEWVVWFVVILVVVGPKRLPGIARKIGRMSEVFRRAADELCLLFADAGDAVQRPAHRCRRDAACLGNIL